MYIHNKCPGCGAHSMKEECCNSAIWEYLGVRGPQRKSDLNLMWIFLGLIVFVLTISLI